MGVSGLGWELRSFGGSLSVENTELHLWRGWLRRMKVRDDKLVAPLAVVSCSNRYCSGCLGNYFWAGGPPSQITSLAAASLPGQQAVVIDNESSELSNTFLT